MPVPPDRAILNCGAACGDSLRLVRPCDRTWGSLEPTGEPRVRYCDGCEALVYRVLNEVEARVRARQGECIAVPAEVARVDLEAVIAGDRRSPAGLAADGFDAAACED